MMQQFAAQRRVKSTNIFNKVDPVELLDMWAVIREAYLCSWVAAGRDREFLARWLDSGFMEQREHRERQLQFWNAARMRLEDRCRLSVRQEARAMGAEDRDAGAEAPARGPRAPGW